MTTKATTPTTSMPVKADAEKPRRCFIPKTDIVETPTEFVAEIDLPGARRKDTDVSFENGALRIHARVEIPERTSTRSLWREFQVGDFYRSFEVHEALDAERIGASLEDGVLRVTLPKAAAATARKILVESK